MTRFKDILNAVEIKAKVEFQSKDRGAQDEGSSLAEMKARAELNRKSKEWKVIKEIVENREFLLAVSSYWERFHSIRSDVVRNPLFRDFDLKRLFVSDNTPQSIVVKPRFEKHFSVEENPKDMQITCRLILDIDSDSDGNDRDAGITVVVSIEALQSTQPSLSIKVDRFPAVFHPKPSWEGGGGHYENPTTFYSLEQFLTAIAESIVFEESERIFNK